MSEIAEMQNSAIFAYNLEREKSVDFIIVNSFLMDDILIENEIKRIRDFTYEVRGDFHMADLAMHSGPFLEEQKSIKGEKDKDYFTLSLCSCFRLFFPTHIRYV